MPADLAKLAAVVRAAYGVDGAVVPLDGGYDRAASVFRVVLCHADLHTYNVLVDNQGHLWLLDWDEVMLAPRERNVMFVLGGGISRDLVDAVAERNFMNGYGEAEPDPLALAYYRHAWAVQDIAGFGTEAATGDEDAAGMLEGLFQPGQIVDLARQSR